MRLEKKDKRKRRKKGIRKRERRSRGGKRDVETKKVRKR
jgi:hypothetical protein